MIYDGIIRKGIGGFYYVETEKGIIECTARGIFRKKKITPYAGDYVKVSCDSLEEGVIDEIKERKNYLIRPPVANIDVLIVIASILLPKPDTLIIDKSIAVAEIRDIEPVLVITKSDLADEDDEINRLKDIYTKAGIQCIISSSVDKSGSDEVKEMLDGKICVLTGNSGAGKSTLINTMFPDLNIETSAISKKLGRGRHTTREVELHKISDSTYIADTPGFSTFDICKYYMTDKDEIMYGFRDIMPYFGQCRFSTCSHTCEKGCAVIDALNKGEISQSRFERYVAMYHEVKDIKPWQVSRNV